MDNSKPISIQNVNGNVTVTIIEGNNNKTELSIDSFTKRFSQDCGLRLIYNDDYFKKDNNTNTNFQDWLKGFSFNIKSIYHGREFRREELLKNIKIKLEEKQRLIILGESGTSKSVLLMEILCDYLKNSYKIFHNLESGSIESSSSEIKNLEFIEDTLLALVESGEKILIVVDNVHNKTIANIFYVIKKIRDDNEDKLDKIRFLLSARQPDFKLAMDKGLFDSKTMDYINILFDEERKLFDIDKEKKSKLYFTEDEVRGFIEKYKEYLHPLIRYKSLEENANEIFEDTKGHPIMVRFSVLQNGLESHVKQMYTGYLIQKDGDNISPNIERIKSIIACSLYDISSIPLREEELFNKLDLKKPSFEIINTMIKRTGNFWTTIHPRWDLELLKYMLSLNEGDRIKIQETFGFVLTKILDIQAGLFNQLLILDTVYNTIAAYKFVDIKIIQEMINVDDIAKKLDDPFFKVLFFAKILGVAFSELNNHTYAIVYFDKAIDMKLQHRDIYINNEVANAYFNKGNSLSALGRKEEAIDNYNKAIETNQDFKDAYYNKGIVLRELGRKEEAIDNYNKAIEIDPNYAKAHLNKGIVVLTLGKYEDAIACFDKAIRIERQYSDAYINKGTALLYLNRKEEALACFDKAIEIEPHTAMAYYNKGIIFSDLDKKEEAIDNYNKAIEIDQYFKEAHLNKGIVLSTLDRKEEALACFDKAIEIDPNYTLAYFHKALI